ncbi:MAG: thioredoxin domain-containing protein [Patescibacteria group bacterium]|nr:thioredoxin domain-containing protein [Patescibacteria group bacterium]
MKKFYFISFAVVIAFAVLLFYQIRQTKNISIDRANKPLIEEAAVEIPVDPNDPIYGNQGAAITVTEFIDLNSDSGRQVHAKIKKFVSEHPTEVRLIWKDMPYSGFFSAGDYLPHQAAWCVFKQDKTKYWDYLDAIILLRGKINVEKNLSAALEEQKLNLSAWQYCLNSSEAKARIDASVSLAKSLGLKKGPEIFINNKKVNFLDEIDLDKLLTELIKKY